MTDRRQALICLLDEAGPRLHGLLTRLTLRHDVAEDLLQDLFVRLAESRGFLTAEDRTAYACRAAINLGLNWRRAQARNRERTEPPESTAASGPPVLTRMIETEQAERILDAAGRLSEIARAALVMRYVEQESYEAVGRGIGRTAHQARAVCHKAVRQIRQMLAEED